MFTILKMKSTEPEDMYKYYVWMGKRELNPYVAPLGVDDDIDHKRKLLCLPSNVVYHFHLSSTIPELTEHINKIYDNEHYYRYGGQH
jgi:hypothetical protein